MAHIEKYKAPAMPHLSDHYTREKGSLNRGNIDQNLTVNNYALDFVINGEKKVVSLVEPEKPKNRVKQRIEDVESSIGKKVRKDAVVMADMVLTIPENVPVEDEKKFFAHSYLFLGSKIGYENLLGCFVHKDEPNARSHAHIPFTPILEGKFNYKKLCQRAFYQTLHRELGDYLESVLGYRPEIELGEEKAEQKALSSVPQEKLNEARAALDKELKETADRLEYLRQREANLGTTVAQLKDDGRVIYNHLKELEREIEECREREPEPEIIKANNQLRRRVQQLTEQRDELNERVGSIVGVIGLVRQSIKTFLERTYRNLCEFKWLSADEFREILRSIGVKEEFQKGLELKTETVGSKIETPFNHQRVIEQEI